MPINDDLQLGALRKKKKAATAFGLDQGTAMLGRQKLEAGYSPFGAVPNIKRTPNFSSNISEGMGFRTPNFQATTAKDMGFRQPNFKFSFDDVI